MCSPDRGPLAIYSKKLAAPFSNFSCAASHAFMIYNIFPVLQPVSTPFHMSLHLYNSLTQRKEVFTPRDPDRITMYVCGPTVYNHVHIGNGRPAVVFDVLFRLLRMLYRQVLYARNITDLDDRINSTARKAGKSIDEVTTGYIASYREDVAALGCLLPTVEPRATAHIAQMIVMITNLIEAGHAYVEQGHVLFHVPSDPHYGILSRRSPDQMIAGARVEVAPYKKHPADFVLWKPSDKKTPGWESPWGIGRPGWHLECSAMVQTHLGKNIDIHGGGHDLLFPHHENELAQARCAMADCNFARYWLHNGMLTVGNEKMAKSKNNFTTIKDLRKTWHGEVIRYALLSGQYRSSLDWSHSALAQAKSSLDRIYLALRQIDPADWNQLQSTQHPRSCPGDIITVLCDDLNTPAALSRIHDRVNKIFHSDDNRIRLELGTEIYAAGRLLGLPEQTPATYFQGYSDVMQKRWCPSPQTINALIRKRNEARLAGNFVHADRIRGQLKNQGIILEDTREGTSWRYQHQD